MALPPGIPPLVVGSSLTGNAGDTYAIRRLLGTGGAGRVYLAQEGEGGPPVVVKVPRGWRQVEDLFAEARHTLQVELPHMARVRRVRITQRSDPPRADDPLPVPILVMDAYRCSLYEVLLTEGPILPEEALRWTGELAEALQASQLLHRDVKLENVLLDDQRQVWLCDWGLAIPANPEVRRRQDLRIDGIVGTSSQLVSDFTSSDHGRVVLSGSQHRVLLRQPPDVVATLDQALNWTPEQQGLMYSVVSCKGMFSEALIDIPNQGICDVARFVPTPYAYWIFTTAPEDVKQRDIKRNEYRAQGLHADEALDRALQECAARWPHGFAAGEKKRA